jgi:predicted RNA-binding Zn ribbon-like protein
VYLCTTDVDSGTQDEVKPFCKRCTSTGRPCDGYNLAFDSSHSAPSPSGVETGYTDTILQSYLPASLNPTVRLKTTREYESLDFFIKHASISLGGIVASPFWHRELLRAAHWHSSIRHALIALGAMYRRYFQGATSSLLPADDSDVHLRFALQQCNEAIHALTEPTQQDSEARSLHQINVITCAVLFGSMACLQGHQRAILQHFSSGIRIMHELDREPQARSKQHPINLETLRSILIGFDLQARTVMTYPESREWEPVLHWQPTPSADQISPLTVHQYFEALYDQTLSFAQETVIHPEQPRSAIRHKYLTLLAGFNAGTSMLDNLSAHTSPTAEPQTIKAIRLLQYMTEYYLRCDRAGVHSAFNFLHLHSLPPLDAAAQFTKIMDLAIQLLTSTTSTTPVFTPNNGPTSALWLIVTQAPSGCTALRRRAANLLLKYPRREGMCDGLLAGQVTSDMLQWEQEYTRAALGLEPPGPDDEDLEVPDHLRIMPSRVCYMQNDNRKARLEFSNAQAMARGEAGIVRVIAW